MARKLSVFSSLMSSYSFNDNFYQKIIIYLESVYNKLYFDRTNFFTEQNGGRENYQCSCV